MITDGIKDTAKGSFKSALLLVIGAFTVYAITKLYEKLKG